jgi:hypothetical protein
MAEFKMSSAIYDIPKSLEAEAKIIANAFNVVIKEFEVRCAVEKKRIYEERNNKLNARVWIYSVQEIDMEGDWMVMYKEASHSTITGESSDVQWSIPFKIINNALIQSRNAWKNTLTGGKILEQALSQGLVADNYIEYLQGIKW